MRSGTVTSTWGGKVYQVPHTEVEILCDGDLNWIPSRKGEMHNKAVVGGQGYLPSSQPGFESIGIGKVSYENHMAIGKIVSTYKCLFIPRENREVEISRNYYILVDNLQL